MPRRIDAVIHAKGGPTKYWVHRTEHTFQKPDISVENILRFLLVLCNIQIFWDTEFWVLIIWKPYSLKFQEIKALNISLCVFNESI